MKKYQPTTVYKLIISLIALVKLAWSTTVQEAIQSKNLPKETVF